MAADTRRTLFRAQGHFATDPGREWKPRRHDPDDQFLHSLAGYSARAIDHLPGFRTRSSLSISRVIRGAWPHVSREFLKGQGPLMPMIDVYASKDLLPSGSDRRLGEALTLAALRAEGVAAPSPYYLENTGVFIHRMDPATVQTAAEPLARTVRIQIITPPGALTRDAQKQLVKDATGILANICGDPSLAKRTWVLLTEAAEGGWGIGGTAFGREEFTALAAAARKKGQPCLRRHSILTRF